MTTFNVPDMSCGHCTAAIEKATLAQDKTAVLTFDLAGRTVEITSTLDDAQIAGILTAEGYPNTPSR